MLLDWLTCQQSRDGCNAQSRTDLAHGPASGILRVLQNVAA